MCYAAFMGACQTSAKPKSLQPEYPASPQLEASSLQLGLLSDYRSTTIPKRHSARSILILNRDTTKQATNFAANTRVLEARLLLAHTATLCFRDFDEK